jgi:two-component system LytT family response regulator
MNATERIRAVIVDDEPLARQLLREYLSVHHDIEIVAECENGYDAIRAVAEQDPSLLFLDIQMPKLDGFEVLELLDRDLAVIFVTAYDQHALRAFEVHAADYLLKPFSPERLADALVQARARIGKPSAMSAARLVADARPDRSPAERILVRDQAKVHVLGVERVDFIEAQDDYVCIHAGDQRFLKSQTLGDIEESLDPRRFVRIHRSYLMNLDRLQRLEPYAKDSRMAILKDGRELPVSRAGYARLRELMG